MKVGDYMANNINTKNKKEKLINSVTRRYAIVIYALMLIVVPILITSEYTLSLQGGATIIYQILMVLKFILCSIALYSVVKRKLILETCSLYLLISVMISILIEKVLGYVFNTNGFRLDILYQYVDAEIFITSFFTFRLTKLKTTLNFLSQDIFSNKKLEE